MPVGTRPLELQRTLNKHQEKFQILLVPQIDNSLESNTKKAIIHWAMVRRTTWADIIWCVKPHTTHKHNLLFASPFFLPSTIHTWWACVLKRDGGATTRCSWKCDPSSQSPWVQYHPALLAWPVHRHCSKAYTWLWQVGRALHRQSRLGRYIHTKDDRHPSLYCEAVLVSGWSL